MIKFVRLCLDRFFFSRSCCCRCRCCCCFFFILLSGVNCPIFLEKLYTPIVLSSSSDSAPVLFLALYLCKKLSGKADNKRANTHTHNPKNFSPREKKWNATKVWTTKERWLQKWNLFRLLWTFWIFWLYLNPLTSQS